MRKILIKLIKIYQTIPLRAHLACRFYPTCSNYALALLNNKNISLCKAIFLIIKRIFKCNPLYKGSYIDLPPVK